MFCLFKNSHLYPKVNFYIIAAAWIGVLFWLNFTFLEKELVFKVMSGEAILVDLLFGLPLVLMLAVVVYATIYWFLKLVIVYLFPQAIMPASELDESLAELAEDPELEQALQDKYGETYWHNKEDTQNQQNGRQEAHSQQTESQSETSFELETKLEAKQDIKLEIEFESLDKNSTDPISEKK